MLLSSELAGQRYHARSATIALAILLFISVYQFLSLAISDKYWHALPFLITFGVQIRGLLSVHQTRQSDSLSCLLSVVFTWIALYLAMDVMRSDHWSWFYLATISGYFLMEIKTANVVNMVSWACLFALLWFFHSTRLDLAVWVCAIALLVLINVVIGHIKRLEDKLGTLHVTDPVTGCSNRESLEREMAKSVELHKRYNVVTSALALRIHNHADLNATNSAKHVNSLLKELTQVWTSRLRNTDLLCRYGDDQFICLLPSTELKNALLLSDDLLKASEGYDFSGNQKIQLVVSVAESSADDEANHWLQRTLSQ